MTLLRIVIADPAIAVADLIPSLRRRPEPLETVKQMFWIGLGIAIIATTHLVLEP
ncbi:MAG: hypothetical protein ACYC9Z_07375 [Casimicrobiaceae bacterium]